MIPKLSDLRRSIFSDGATIVAVMFFVQSGVRFAGNLILTRLLYPEAFGLMSIVSSVLAVLALSSDFGFRAYLIRHPNLDGSRVTDTVWTVQVIRTALLVLILIGGAYPIARLYGRTELFGALLLVSLNVAMDGLRSTSYFIAEREQRFFKISVLDTSLFIVQIVLTVILAYFLRSYWALLIASVFSSIASVIASYVAFPNSVSRFRIDRSVFKDLWAFSRIVMPSSFLTLFILQSDKLLIGKAFNLQILGVYSIAASMAALFVNFAYKIIVSVMYPRLAKAYREAPEALGDIFYRERVKFIPLLLISEGAVLALGPLLFRILYDQRYENGGLYLSILMITPLLAVVSKSCEVCLVAMGRIKATLVGNILRASWLVVTFVPFYRAFDLYGVLACVALMELPTLIYFLVKLQREGILKPSTEAASVLYVGAGLVVGLLIAFLAPPA